MILSSPSPGDFWSLVNGPGIQAPAEQEPPPAALVAHGTTVIAVKYDQGVLNVGDRRATAGNVVMYDRAEKIIPLDDHTLIAVSGSYAGAMQAVRFLQHSFKYYRRSQLQEVSLEGKISELSRVISQNVANALSGIGGFLPILSAWDFQSNEARIFFYDGLGARFETAEFGAAGSGSERIRGAFDYVIKTKGPFHHMPLEQSLGECLVLLDIAAALDTATGGLTKILPLVKAVTAAGIVAVEEDRIRSVLASIGYDGR